MKSGAIKRKGLKTFSAPTPA